MQILKRIIPAILFYLACAVVSLAQSTTVSGTVTDAGSQTWNNGTYTFKFVPNPQYPTGPYTWTGGALNTTITGSLSGSGTYSVSIPSNSAITPTGSKWILTVSPNAAPVQAFSTAATTITGGTQTLNATPPAILIPWSIPMGPAISAYADGEIGGTLPAGAEYFNTTNLVTRVWNGSAWANQGSGSSSTCGSSPGQLLYNNAGTCAGTPAITTDGAGDLTVGGEVITGEVLANAAVGGNLALTCSPAPCTVQYGTNGQNVTNAFTGSLASVTTSTGMTVGSPTGGAEGLGTVNATGLFVNGVAVTTGGLTGITFPQTVGGTVNSGGIPYFNSTTQMSSSAALTANSPVLGGGAGTAPSTKTFLTTNGSSQLTIGVAGGGNGVLGLAGTTSGTATITAPSVAGTSTNPIVLSNVLNAPSGTFVNESYGFNNGEGMWDALNGLVFTSNNANLYFQNTQGNSSWIMLSSSSPVGELQPINVENIGDSSHKIGTLFATTVNSAAYQTATNCSSSASPAVCSAAAAGSVAVPAGTNSSLVIDTTAVTANSQVLLTIDESLGTKLSVTCNSTLSTLSQPVVTARTAGTSFTIQMPSTTTTNPVCVSYLVLN